MMIEKQRLNYDSLHNPHLVGEPFFWESGPVGVLLTHGYSATTAEVRPVAQKLHQQGYTVMGTLLPGHGTTPQEMNCCRWQDWAGAMEDAYHLLARRCEHVFVGGESMGALLALYLAARYSSIAGILAYAPALRISWRSVLLAYLCSPFIKFVNKRAERLNAKWQGYPVQPVPAITQLHRLQRVVARMLPQIQQPILIVQGRQDIDIDLRGVDQLYENIGSSLKEFHWMEESSHVVMLDCEFEAAAEKTIQFMERVLGRDAYEV